MLPVVLERIEQVTDSISTFYLRPEKPVDYVAGMFTELYLPHEDTDIRGQRRWFTISSSPTEELLAITTVFEEPGSSFKRQLARLEPGTALKIAEPMGDFVLPKDRSLPLVFVAGGIGITPFRAMVQWLQDKQLSREITLIYSAATEDSLIFKDLFDAYKMTAHYIVTRPEPTWTGLSGRLTAHRILELATITPKTQIYLSGPEEMVEGLTNNIIDLGIQSNRVITDYFPGYKAV